MSPVTARIMRLPHGADLPLPSYQSAGASGLDLFAAVPADAPLTIAPGQYAAVPTGIAIALPPGTEAQVRPRSGLARNYGVTVLNSPGTVDADYRMYIATTTGFDGISADMIGSHLSRPATYAIRRIAATGGHPSGCALS